MNERLVTYLDTAAGRCAVVKVGATCVARIKAAYDDVLTHAGQPGKVHPYSTHLPVEKGGELGRFEMGSTVILLFEPGRVKWDDSLQPEAVVRMGGASERSREPEDQRCEGDERSPARPGGHAPGAGSSWSARRASCSAASATAEVRTPMVEDTALFVRSVGEETDIVGKEMYTFEDKGGRSLSLRPEGTAPAVRAYIEHSVANQEPVTRWYYMGPMFRYERMKTGRYRQFCQIGAEAFGVAASRRRTSS